MQLLLVFCILFSIFGQSISVDKGRSNCAEGVCLEFEHLDFPIAKNFPFEDRVETLSLIAAGMRRKSLLIFEVDVYTVGVYVGVKKDEVSFYDVKNNFPADISTPSGDICVDLAIVLHFVRQVATNSVVDAIVEALSGPGEEYKTALNHFTKILLNAIGRNGMQKNSELAFSFYGNAGDAISVYFNDNFVAEIKSYELRKNLINIYTSENAVAPQVPKILNKRFSITV